MSMSIRDLVFSPLYPYRYQYYKSDGTSKIVFSKKPMIVPSIIEQAKLQKIIKENELTKFAKNRKILSGEDNE